MVSKLKKKIKEILIDDSTIGVLTKHNVNGFNSEKNIKKVLYFILTSIIRFFSNIVVNSVVSIVSSIIMVVFCYLPNKDKPEMKNTLFIFKKISRFEGEWDVSHMFSFYFIITLTVLTTLTFTFNFLRNIISITYITSIKTNKHE